MYQLKCVVVVLIGVTLTSARSAASGGSTNAIPQEVTEGRSESSSSSLLSDFRFLHKVYQDCSVSDLSTCLKLKLVTAMERASRAYPVVQLVDGVTFVKDNVKSEQPAAVKLEADIEAELPRALNDREDALNSLIVDKFFEFFQTHTLQIKLPTGDELQRSFAGEERGKRKKMSGLLLIPLLLGGTLIPLALGGLALLAGKALIVSKLALVLAAIIGLKKLFSGGHGGHGHEEVVVASPGHGHGSSGWGRAYEKNEQAQNLAYNAYAPKPSR